MPTMTSAELDALGLELEDGRRPGRPTSATVKRSPPPGGRRTSGGSAALIAGRTQRRDPTTGLNQTEAAFFREVLEPLRVAGSIHRIDFEPEGLRVGLPGTKAVYWPDFRIQWADGVIEFIEVKGHWLEDARGKIKAAAALHPYTFRGVQRKPKKAGGGWTFETFGAWPTFGERAADQALQSETADPERSGKT